MMMKSPMRQACGIDAVAVDIVAVVVYAEGGAVAVTPMSFPEHYCVGKILCGGTCRRRPTLAADAVFDDIAVAAAVAGA